MYFLKEINKTNSFWINKNGFFLHTLYYILGKVFQLMRCSCIYSAFVFVPYLLLFYSDTYKIRICIKEKIFGSQFYFFHITFGYILGKVFQPMQCSCMYSGFLYSVLIQPFCIGYILYSKPIYFWLNKNILFLPTFYILGKIFQLMQCSCIYSAFVYVPYLLLFYKNKK